MLTYYYDIKDESRIPQDSSFKDPYDYHIHKPNPNESLPDFIKRIEKGREKRKCPKIPSKDLRQLVIDQLLMTTKNKELIPTYFVQKKTMPSFSAVLGFITTVAYDLTKGGGISVKQQEERLSKCIDGGCTFNRSSTIGGINKAAVKIVAKLTDTIKANDMAKTRYELDPKLDKKIGNCAMCGGCNLREKKHYSTQGVVAGLAPEGLDRILPVYGSDSFERCWQLKEAVENPKTRKALEDKLRYCKNVNGLEVLKEYDEKKKNGK